MFSLYPCNSNPLKINSNKVFKFSGEGAVTQIFENPYATAAAIATPIAADLPQNISKETHDY